MFWYALIALVALVAFSSWHRYRRLPPAVGRAWPWRDAEDIRFHADLCYRNHDGKRQITRAIPDAMVDIISQAQHRLTLDNFLFNPDQANDPDHIALCERITAALITQKERYPQLEALVVTDPVNTGYGSFWPEHLQRLEKAGIPVAITDLSQLRDGNPTWSGLWRLLIRPLGNRRNGGWLPSPLGPQKLTLRSYLALLNVKANHRKTLTVTSDSGRLSMVSSANLHDGSSCHNNLALTTTGALGEDIERSEWGLIQRDMPCGPAGASVPPDRPRIRLLTEAAIRDAVLARIKQSDRGDRIRVAVFYLTHRAIIDALKSAHQRGVNVQILLDPNRDAFGHTKSGMPNRPMSTELHRAALPVRWYQTSGEQFHGKLLHFTTPSGLQRLFVGSANLTRRNLDNLNLETMVELEAPGHHPVMAEVSDWFDRCWHNRGGTFSIPWEELRDERRWRYWLYRWLEWSGWCTF